MDDWQTVEVILILNFGETKFFFKAQSALK